VGHSWKSVMSLFLLGVPHDTWCVSCPMRDMKLQQLFSPISRQGAQQGGPGQGEEVFPLMGSPYRARCVSWLCRNFTWAVLECTRDLHIIKGCHAMQASNVPPTLTISRVKERRPAWTRSAGGDKQLAREGCLILPSRLPMALSLLRTFPGMLPLGHGERIYFIIIIIIMGHNKVWH
jgi:hypothetical protein